MRSSRGRVRFPDSACQRSDGQSGDDDDDEGGTQTDEAGDRADDRRSDQVRAIARTTPSPPPDRPIPPVGCRPAPSRWERCRRCPHRAARTRRRGCGGSSQQTDRHPRRSSQVDLPQDLDHPVLLAHSAAGLLLHVENDANLAAPGEYAAGAVHGDLICLRFGDRGIGRGKVLGGKLLRGAGGFAGDLGHIHIRIHVDDNVRCAPAEVVAAWSRCSASRSSTRSSRCTPSS